MLSTSPGAATELAVTGNSLPRRFCDCTSNIGAFSVMSARNGKPCKKCGANEWKASGGCAACAREYDRHYRQNHKAKIREYFSRYREDNHDKIQRNATRRNKLVPNKNRENTSRWQKDNPEASLAKQHRYRTRKTAAGGSYNAAEWQALVNHYGGKCLCCGRDDVKLTADHVVPVSKGGSSNIDNIQPLCFSCNSSKGAKTIDYRPSSGIGRWIQRKLFG